LSRSAIEPRFIDGPRGKLFVILRKPPGRASGPCVLLVPPFAEEMNKSRRMFTLLAEGLARRGVASLLPDLHGTGDSAGEFRDADWDLWKAELVQSSGWAAAAGWRLTGLLGLRLGCALAAESSAELPARPERSVFWQPVSEGERFVTQFLRVRVAASMMADQKESVSDLRKQLQSGATLEVAGYELSGRLIAQLDRVRLADSIGERLGELHWMEVVRDLSGSLPPATERFLQSVRERATSLFAHTVSGEPFWSATEIVVLPELITRTVDLLTPPA